MIYLSEKPYPVIQGEGRTAGQQMILIRVFGCTLKCSFCDSKFSWTDKIQFDVPFFVKTSSEKKFMITGGQPSLYVSDFIELFADNPDKDFYVEDDGSIFWEGCEEFNNVFFTFSPKQDFNFNLQNLKMKNYDIKFIADSCKKIRQIKGYVLNNNISSDKIWIMPLGMYRSELLQENYLSDLCDLCLVYGFNFTIRNHIIIYDNRRFV